MIVRLDIACAGIGSTVTNGAGTIALGHFVHLADTAIAAASGGGNSNRAIVTATAGAGTAANAGGGAIAEAIARIAAVYLRSRGALA